MMGYALYAKFPGRRHASTIGAAQEEDSPAVVIGVAWVGRLASVTHRVYHINNVYSVQSERARASKLIYRNC